MEDNNNTTFFTFDSPKGQSSYIKVIGVGGGGGNAVNHMYKEGIEGVDFIVSNTDMKALTASPVPNKIPLGDLGLGAGNKPERARAAAESKADVIREAISHNTQMLFITAGMGGGTGTGAAPVIAEIAKSIDLDNDENKKILVVAIVTRPFSFEGQRRRDQAEAGIEELRKHVDSIIVINNDKLRSFGNMTMSAAFGMADDVLLTAVKGIAEIITQNAYVNRDFQDVNTVMEHSGTALMGTGSGKGANRAHDAIEAATTSVLLDDSDISGAKNVLLYFTYSSEHEITMDEHTEITDYVLDKTNGTADIIWGAGPDENLGDELKVILVATGFEKSTVSSEPKRIELPDEAPAPQPAPQPTAKAEPDSDGIEIIRRSEPVPAAAAPAAPASQPAPQPASVAPVAASVSAPGGSAAGVPAPAAPQPGKRVFVLDDDEPTLEEARRVAQEQVQAEEFKTEIDAMVDDIHIVQSETKPETQPAPAPVATAPAAFGGGNPAPQPQVIDRAFHNDNDVTTAAERIRRIHELLRSNPDGADIVQQMSTAELANGDIYSGPHSSQREATSLSVRPDGKVVKNPYLYGKGLD